MRYVCDIRLKWVLYVIATDSGTIAITTIQRVGFTFREPGLFQVKSDEQSKKGQWMRQSDAHSSNPRSSRADWLSCLCSDHSSSTPDGSLEVLGSYRVVLGHDMSRSAFFLIMQSVMLWILFLPSLVVLLLMRNIQRMQRNLLRVVYHQILYLKAPDGIEEWRKEPKEINFLSAGRVDVVISWLDYFIVSTDDVSSGYHILLSLVWVQVRMINLGHVV